MSKRQLILCCVGIALLVAAYFAMPPREDVRIIAQAQKQDGNGIPYGVTVKRWKDHYRGGRYKCRNDRFYIDFLQHGKSPIATYEFEGEIPLTNAAITWSGSNSFVVAFDRSVTVTCTWQDGKAAWERK